MGYNSVVDIMGLSSFVVGSQNREIPTKFDLMAVQGQSRPSILVSIEIAC